MKEKRKELIIILGSLLVVVLSVSIAYFSTTINSKNSNVSTSSAELKIVFTSGSGTIAGSEIEPGWSSGVNTFTVKNQSNSTYKYNLVIKDLINTFVTTGYLQYKVTSTDGGYNMSDFTDVPKSTSATDTILAYSVEIAKGATHTYNVEFRYLNSTSESQNIDMGKKLSGTLFIEEGTTEPIPLYNKILADNPTISTRTDFSTTFTTTNTETLFKATESIAGSDATDVYYFAGDAKNNWVKFGKYQTNKVVYRGYYSATSSDFVDYSTMDACIGASIYNINCTEYVLWNKGNDIYWRIIRTNHDGSVRLLYSGTSPDTTGGYIGTSAFSNTNNDPMYVGYMYGTSGTLASNRTNENSSTIKGVIDTWYSNNLSSYSKYISTEAVYCNDRELKSGLTYTTADSGFDYAANERLHYKKTPTYDCANSKDAFSGSNSEAKLTYPIALMTADEITYAGGYTYTPLSSPYAWYYSNSVGESITGSIWWWLLSPNSWDGEGGARLLSVGGSTLHGSLIDLSVNSGPNVRPVISLKGNLGYKSGNGSPENPYEIVYN